MLNPIYADHEIICPCGCGVVLQNIEEPVNNDSGKQTIPPALNVFLLGTAITTNRNFYFNRDKKQIYHEKALRRLRDITKEYSLPDRIAIEAMNVVTKRKRGLYSFHEQIKQLLIILSKDENYMYFPKKNAIKVKYENVTGI